MTEPGRKRNKALNVPILVGAVTLKADDNSLRFVSDHPTKPGTFDGTEFAAGRKHEAPKSGFGRQYRGGFRGRPKLVASLMPYIRKSYGASARNTIENVVKALRTWWLLFEKYQEQAPIEDVEDFDGQLHGALAYQEGLLRENASFVNFLNEARKARGLSPVHVILGNREYRHVDLPDEEAIRSLRLDLQHCVGDVARRWETADRMVTDLGDWKFDFDCEQAWTYTEAQVHATYRQSCAILGVPYINSNDWAKRCGFEESHRVLTIPRNGVVAHPLVKGWASAMSGLYPSKRDAVAIFYLFLLKSGWNQSVALAININSGIRAHPTKSEFHLLQAPKERSGGELQYVVGLEKAQYSVGNLLRLLIGRTWQLRAVLQQQLKELEEKQKALLGRWPDVALSELQKKRLAFLRRAVVSPWLHRNQLGRIDDLTPVDFSAHQLSKFIDEFNEKRAPDKRINRNIKPSDFRDAYISAQYRDHGHSWLIGQLAAGHKNPRTLSIYLRKRQWKAHGERQVQIFTTFLWDEIRSTKKVDPAILYRLVQHGDLTEEQRQRWLAHKDRTHVGVGCRDFRHPPKTIAPHHVDGHGCRVQRCTLCPHAVIFEDSLDGLAKRLATLGTIKQRVPLTAWNESSWPEEVEATEKALHENWSADAVAERLKFWIKEIDSDPKFLAQFETTFEGEYV